MKHTTSKALLIVALSVLALAGCSKYDGAQTSSREKELIEIAVAPQSASPMTKGYAEGALFYETFFKDLHGEEHNNVARTMKISSYMYQQGETAENYFVGKTYAKCGGDEYWHNTSDGITVDPIYWPAGAELDFLAYSLTGETEAPGAAKNVSVAWDNNNAASKVTLTVPAENSQNDILYSSISCGDPMTSSQSLKMSFMHSQAWLQFVLKGSVNGSEQDLVKLKRIELNDVYNAGVLTIINNGGNALATWDFAGEQKRTIPVDNYNLSSSLRKDEPLYLDMLIPQQPKTSFTLYYSIGEETVENSYFFETDYKTWLMGEKYIYNITMSASEVVVRPSVEDWETVTTEYLLQ